MSKLSVFGRSILAAVCAAVPTQAAVIGDIFVCYACQNTGDAAIDAALANNPGVAGDGILFAFIEYEKFRDNRRGFIFEWNFAQRFLYSAHNCCQQ